MSDSLQPMNRSTPGLPVHHHSRSLPKLMFIELLSGDANDTSISYTLINSRFSIEMKSSIGELPSENLQLGFPRGSDGRESACKAGDPGSIPGSGGSRWSRKWQPTLAFLPREFHGQRSLAVYNPWGHKKLYTSDHLMLSFT